MGLNESIAKIQPLEKKDLATVVDRMIEEAAVLTGSSISYFALLNKTEDTLIMIGWSRKVMDNCSMIDKPIVYPLTETGLWGDCVRERKPVVTNDYKRCDKPTKKGYPAGHVDVMRHMNVCMMDGDHVAGVLGVGNKESDYGDEDVRNLQEFANRCFSFLPPDDMEGVLS